MAGKTRVTVEIEGKARELFSVEVRKGGDVMVYVKASREIATSRGAQHEEVAEHRFSLHVSPRSPGHTIKQTLRTAAGPTTTSALVLPTLARAKSPAGLLLPPRSRFCWPVYMARPPRLDSGRYDSTPKKADRMVALGSFDPAIASIVYLLVATSADVTTLPSIRGRYAVTTLPFGVFNLHVALGYSPVPSLPTGDFLAFATGPQASGSEPLSPARAPRQSYGIPAVEGIYFKGLATLRDRYAEQFLGVDMDGMAAAGPATMMWGLAAVSVPKPPATAADVSRSFDEYMAEVQALSTIHGRSGKSARELLPAWLEEARREHQSKAAGSADREPTP